jgi:hypothetical protein
MRNVYVYLWFDIEDYITKESHELPLTAFRILKKYHVPVTCKVVAEKVRALQENGRDDVIKAISEYDVGYHLDTHSKHPTLYEYLADLNVRSGTKEFLARENDGYMFVEQVFGRKPSCFGHPGPTWAPQVYPALSQLGIPVYLDESAILNLDNEPYWYCGLLNLNGANRNFIVFDYTFEDPNGIRVLRRKFKRICENLRNREGGAVSILFHLHTSINRKFWDEVNFGYGENKEKEEYERPPSQTHETTERAWSNFEELISYISQFEHVKFITASEALKIYETTVPRVEKSQMLSVAKHFRSSTDFLENQSQILSSSECFYVIVKALKESASIGKIPEQVETVEPLGPLAPFRSQGRQKLRTTDLMDAASSTLEVLSQEGYIPTSIKIGDYAVLSPEDFLATASTLLFKILTKKNVPAELYVSKAKPPNARYISAANFRKACKWKVLPRNFQAPKILEQIKLQAWTLKPARLVGEGE